MIAKNIFVFVIALAVVHVLMPKAVELLEARVWPRDKLLAFTVQHPEGGGRSVYYGRLQGMSADSYRVAPYAPEDKKCKRGDVAELSRKSVVAIAPFTADAEISQRGAECRVHSIESPHSLELRANVEHSRLIDAAQSVGAQIKSGLIDLAAKFVQSRGSDHTELAAAVRSAGDQINSAATNLASQIAQFSTQPLACPTAGCPPATGPQPEKHSRVNPSPVQRLTIMLPLFPAKVTGSNDRTFGANGISNPEEAFYFGQRDLPDPPLPGSDPTDAQAKNKTLFERIGRGIRECLKATKDAFRGGDMPEDAKLRLSVMGFASDTPFLRSDKTPHQNTDEMNLFLAEGRRLAVIRKLRQKIVGENKDLENMVEFVKMPQRLEFDFLKDVRKDEVKKGFHFSSYQDMRTELERWVKEPPNKSTTASPSSDSSDRTSFARSVIIVFENDALRKCGSTDKPSDR